MSAPLSPTDGMVIRGDTLVAIRNFAFHPDSLKVPVGATVTWVNCETPPQEPHTTTSDNVPPIWDSRSSILR